jgi:lipopolysaccharide/colanic/teichoic acid biosynthesis glycosyltransferase
MSIVGPRPMVEFETKFYGDNINKVLDVTPGLTGYWQVNGRSNATYESGERQRLELYYVENQSLMLDIKILSKTIKVIVKGDGVK